MFFFQKKIKNNDKNLSIYKIFLSKRVEDYFLYF
jgi:hypothetical protein